MKILIIKFGALGDMIIASPIIRCLLKRHKGAGIWLLTTPAHADLFSGHGDLHIKTAERRGLAETLRQAGWLRKMRFERIYDLQSSDRSGLLCALSGAGLRIGNHPRFPYHIHPARRYAGECHCFERLNQMLELADGQRADPKPRLPPERAASDKVRDWLKARDLSGRPFALLHAGSSGKHPQKRWPHYAELARAVFASGVNIIWIGAGEDAALNQRLSRTLGMDATGEFSVPELIALGQEARFAVTNDSAPMHILSCSGTPVYGLFGPTNPRRNHALGHAERVIYAGPEWPRNDAAFVPLSIADIPVARVIEKLADDRMLEPRDYNPSTRLKTARHY